MQPGFQCIQLRVSAVGVNFHSPVRQVARPAGNPHFASGFLGECAEADSLHAASDQEISCCGALHGERL